MALWISQRYMSPLETGTLDIVDSSVRVHGMRHTITVTIDSDRPVSELADDIHDTLIDVAGGYIGEPDQHAVYGATVVSVA